MGWLISIMFLVAGLFRGPIDTFSIGLFIVAGLFAIAGSISAVVDKLGNISAKMK